jgi:lipopolysaccharide/colanic/teichoic acid biosynthesis glycosyltransferase
MTGKGIKNRIIKTYYVQGIYRSCLKHIIDWLFALLALVFLSPLFLVVSIAIKLDSKGPVFFMQERLGRNGKVFKIFKFRSMVRDMAIPVGSQKIFENDPKITRVGRIIRKTSIDELPQLINIIKGEMSFIGPRPPVTTYPKLFDEYTEFEKIRFLVKPGISGLVQVRCREINDWDINIPIDIEYVQNYSFIYDMKLFLRSLLVFFRTDNIYSRE